MPEEILFAAQNCTAGAIKYTDRGRVPSSTLCEPGTPT